MSGGIQRDNGTTNATILFGGQELVLNKAFGTLVSKGGVELVETGGSAFGTIVSSGGTLALEGGASMSGTAILGGGTLEIAAGYSLSGYGVASGVTLEVGAGGTASATTIDSGGHVVALAGGSVLGATISGGALQLSSGAIASSGTTIDFAGAGTLTLEGTGAYHFLVAGFAVPDVIDLTAVNFASATKSYSGNTLSGTLTVTDGTHAVSLQLLGNYMAASFNLGAEGGGGTGTLITDPPVTAAADIAPAGLLTPHRA
jgi:autotransporter passenger strand-loop-strand repeat protein